MHGSAGLHSAMAIKRQRKLREQAKRRALERERKMSSRTSSIDSMENFTTKKVSSNAPPDHRLATSIGMLHIGVCFLVFGLFLIGSGLLPDDVVTWRGGGWWNELVATGIFVCALGIFLIALNRVMSKREEDDLNEYVSRQLTRSRSGHRLERDIETGCLTTKNHRKFIEQKRTSESVPVHMQHIKASTEDVFLEKILEENSFEKKLKSLENKETMSTTTTASLSPGTPSETRELIANARQYSFNSRHF